MRFIKKIKLTKGGSNIKRSILSSHLKVILILENIFYEHLEGFPDNHM